MSIDTVWVHSLKSHNEIKSNILDIIDRYEQRGECPDPVTKTDFYDETLQTNFPDYFQVLSQKAEPLWKELCNKYWTSDFGIMGVWFQQYYNNDFHGWHMHGNSSISMSYLLELDDRKYSTEFIDIERNTTFQLDVEEGDVIIFPSYTIHRSPLIRGDSRKTTIAINLNLGDADMTKINPIDPIFNYE
tara:strand:- start:97 stop:660 length:564 start_codon:yes stop_codon:yes gene_type:complete